MNLPKYRSDGMLKDLEKIIRDYNVHSNLGMDSFIVAEYIEDCLLALKHATLAKKHHDNKRDRLRNSEYQSVERRG